MWDTTPAAQNYHRKAPTFAMPDTTPAKQDATPALPKTAHLLYLIQFIHLTHLIHLNQSIHLIHLIQLIHLLYSIHLTQFT